MEEYLKGLNLPQFEAVTTTEGYVRVIAGAGSGKTRALAARFAYLVREMGILPSNILCVTFTNKAAGEMKRRIHNLTGDNDTGYVNTFHGFCVSILQEDSYAVQYPRSFLVLDNSDIDDMLRIIYEERGLTMKDMTFKDARDMFEVRKCLTEPAYYLDMLNLSLDELRAKYENAHDVRDILFYGYLYQERKCFGLDYNDLIIFSLYIFETHPDIAKKWQERLEYIMIDEFQDIDALQIRLMEVLQGYHKNLFIVGDPDQTIYSWRGASVKFLLNFDKQFPGTKTIFMNDNYRSTPEILQTVNSLIEKNSSRLRKELIPHREDGPMVRANLCADPEEEAKWVADRIVELKKKRGVKYKDMTVLYRSHYLTRSIEGELVDRKIPYNIYSGVAFFDRAEVKDALSYLRMIAAQDDLSFRRVANQPKRNLGIKRMKYLQETAAAEGKTLWQTLLSHREDPIFKGTKAEEFIALIERFMKQSERMPVSKLFTEVLAASGYEAMLRTEGDQVRLDNIAELKQTILQYEISCGEEAALPDFLAHIALFTEADAIDEADKVKLMTVHAAKGLEFPYVFLIGLNEGVFPSKRTDSFEGMEEERRLAFVAMTRAQKGLFLSGTEGRAFDGAPRYMSRFLLDIEPGLVSYDTDPREELVKLSREYAEAYNKTLSAKSAAPDFHVGERVKHPIMGEGVIKDVDMKKNAYIVQFVELKTPRAISFRAKLEKMK